VATFQGVDVEQIVSLEADLVIAGGGNPSFTPMSAIEQLRRVGIRSSSCMPTTSPRPSPASASSGWPPTSPVADHLAAAMAIEMAELGAATAVLDHPKVFYEIDGSSKIYTVPADCSTRRCSSWPAPIRSRRTTLRDLAEELVAADRKRSCWVTTRTTPPPPMSRPGRAGATSRP
jgi:hypothetical protein